MKDLGTSSAWPCFTPGLCLGRMCICLFCCEAGCYYRDSTSRFQPGLRLKHSLAIWSLGHGEIADNLDENSWKIAVFRPLPPAPSFLFSYSLFLFLSLHLTTTIYFRSEEKQASLARCFSPVYDVFYKQTCKLIQNLTTLR